MDRFKQYISAMVLFTVVPLGCVFGANVLFMYKLNELVGVEQAIRMQETGPTLVNSLIGLDRYKAAMLERIEPTIIASGSSRSFAARGFLFHKSFYNLSGGISGLTPESLQRFEHGLLRNRNLRYLVVYLDYWWFTEDRQVEPVVIHTQKKRERAVNFNIGASSGFRESILYRIGRAAFLPFTLMESGNLTAGQYFDVLRGRIKTRLDGLNRVGFGAVFSETGFDRDGSYYYLFLRKHPVVPGNCRYVGNWEFKKKGPHGAYRSNQKIDVQKITAFKDFMANLAKQNIRVIPVIPPLAPSLIDQMEKEGEKFDYIQEWRSLLEKTLPVVWDFNDPRNFGATECEMIDDIHGGDVMHARMYKRILESDPALRDIFSTDRINHTIENFAGFRNTTEFGLRKALNLPSPKLLAETHAQPPAGVDTKSAAPKAADATPMPAKVGQPTQLTQSAGARPSVRTRLAPSKATKAAPGHADRPGISSEEISMRRRAEETAEWLAAIPDFEMRLYDRVRKINSQTVNTIRLLAVGFLVTIVLAPFATYAVLRRRLSLFGATLPSPRASTVAGVAQLKKKFRGLEDLCRQLNRRMNWKLEPQRMTATINHSQRRLDALKESWGRTSGHVDQASGLRP